MFSGFRHHKWLRWCLLMFPIFLGTALPVRAQPKLDEELANEISTRAVRTQVLRLYHDESSERALAAIALGNLGPAAAEAAPFLVAMTGNTARLEWNVIYIGSGSLPPSTLPGTGHGKTTAASEAKHALARIGGAAVDPLLRTLNAAATPSLTRQWTIAALAEIGDARAVEPIAALLSHEKVGVAQAAAKHLAAFASDPRVLQPLIAATRDPRGGVGSRAVSSLGETGSPVARRALLEIAADPALAEIHSRVALVIPRFTDVEVIDGLLELLKSSDAHTAKMAAAGLREIADPRAINGLLAALEREEITWKVLEALGEIGGPRAVAALYDALIAPHPTKLNHDFRTYQKAVWLLGNRGAAAQGLGKLGHQAAAPALATLLRDPWIVAGSRNNKVQYAAAFLTSAARAIEKLRDPIAIPPLIALVEHEGYSVGKTAVKALQSLTGQKFFASREDWEQWWLSSNSDSDGDAVPDVGDNCPDIANPEQQNRDLDGRGDACDWDLDGDAVANQEDNCPDFKNVDQEDSDLDGAGDPCDPDIDGDSLLNGEDNCPSRANPEQEDGDQDRRGDVCDEDADGDRIDNTEDNCAFSPNVDQTDLDQDGVGDPCDEDSDGDGVVWPTDRCLRTPLGAVTDLAGCSVEERCPCRGPSWVRRWSKPRDYAKCVAQATARMKREKRLSATARTALIAKAKSSGCGRGADQQ